MKKTFSKYDPKHENICFQDQLAHMRKTLSLMIHSGAPEGAIRHVKQMIEYKEIAMKLTQEGA